ncbi:hypothetical protein J4E85_005010 [Alternaria conjuncta]|uniref:uncharacterized protein n=1 Tax=Alternaria conjuncta TaxID=181017 RepID=UPI00221E7350|nr:uncharacterized protein J4E85_005010 [Alternaria conjuncta]KAI4930383.1 hypothetical protein J4E85_005010 [Alternaria conjuncta]
MEAMPSSNTASPLLALPRELRDEILGYLILPQYVYTSTSIEDTQHLYRSRQIPLDTYVDTRIYLPSRPPPNVLATCRQLREECLEHRLLLSRVTPTTPDSEEQPLSNVVAERLGTEFAEEAERACDDDALRITVEVQRQLRGAHGYYVPTREEMSPRFLALLPIIGRTKKLRLAIWPGYDWWNGGPQVFIDKRGNARVNPGEAAKPNAASVAISRILQYFPHVEELSVDVLMQASDGGRWDLPDKKWENVQPWLDAPVTPAVGETVRQVTRKLTGFWKTSEPEPFYIQHEVRQSGNTWKVDRKGDMGTPTMKSFCDTGNDADMEFLRSLVVEESFVRND